MDVELPHKYVHSIDRKVLDRSNGRSRDLVDRTGRGTEHYKWYTNPCRPSICLGTPFGECVNEN